MGNCQAAEAATVVVQHPGGRVERLYWATSAAEVMRANPGHYVAFVTQHRDEKQRPAAARPQPQGQGEGAARHGGGARVTRVKLLKPRDTLLLGQAYRLITVAEITRAMQAKKDEKTRRAQKQQQHVVVVQPPKNAGSGDGDDGSRTTQQPVDDSLDQVTLLPPTLSNCNFCRSRTTGTTSQAQQRTPARGIIIATGALLSTASPKSAAS